MVSNDGLTLVSASLNNLNGRLETWKRALESKGLRVDGKKAKMFINEGQVWKGYERGEFGGEVVGSNPFLSVLHLLGEKEMQCYYR